MQNCALCVWDSGNDKIRRHIIYKTSRATAECDSGRLLTGLVNCDSHPAMMYVDTSLNQC